MNNSNTPPSSVPAGNLTPVQIDMDAVLAADERWTAAYQNRSADQMSQVLAPDWVGFAADGNAVERGVLLGALASIPPALLTVELEAWSLLGDTGMTRGTMFADGERIQSFLRVFARRDGLWQGVCLQVVP